MMKSNRIKCFSLTLFTFFIVNILSNKKNVAKPIYKNNKVYLPKVNEMCKLLSPNNTCKYPEEIYKLRILN
jgi:hypothetical protein